MNIKHETHFDFIILYHKEAVTDISKFLEVANFDCWKRASLFCAGEPKCDKQVSGSISLGMGWRMPKHPFIFGLGLAKLVACQDLMILNQLHIQRSFLQILDTVGIYRRKGSGIPKPCSIRGHKHSGVVAPRWIGLPTLLQEINERLLKKHGFFFGG